MGMKNSGLRDKQVTKERLEGYRLPSARETERIKSYLLPDLKKMRRRMTVGSILCAIADICMIAALFTESSAGTAAELAVRGVLAVILTLAVISILKRRAANGTLTANILDGRFEVLDCLAYEGDTTGDLVGGGEVKIHNMQSQYCQERFVVDRESVKEYLDGADIPFLLMKCVCGRNKGDVFFELFTWRKLEGCKKT